MRSGNARWFPGVDSAQPMAKSSPPASQQQSINAAPRALQACTGTRHDCPLRRGMTRLILKMGVRIVALVLFAHFSFCFNFID